MVQDPSLIDRMRVDYSKEIDLVQSVGLNGAIGPDFSSESLNGQTMNGIPGSETIAKIQSHIISSSFKMEKKIRPKVEVRLLRSVS